MTEAPNRSASYTGSLNTIKIAFTLLILIITIGHVLYPKHVDQFVALLGIIAFAPWLLPLFSQYVKSVDLFGAKFDLLAQKVETNSKRLDELYLLSMNSHVFLYLQKLSQPGGFGSFYVSPAMQRELAWLEQLNYIQFKPPFKGTEDFIVKFTGKKDDGNLSDYVELTPEGKSFFDSANTIREEIAKKSVDHKKKASSKFHA